MNSKIYFFLLLSTYMFSQDVVTTLKENAIPISNLEDLDSTIYNKIKPYEVIMMGEMHGTHEPSKFVLGLAELIAKNEGQVILAMEIPKLEMQFDGIIDENSLQKTAFFSKKNEDGRNSQAWFDLILNSSKIKGLQFIYIDNDWSDLRDSFMYLEIKSIKQKNPSTKIVSLTGNIHNWLNPKNNQLKMGGFIKNDKTFDPSKIMSINHIYNEGTMLHSTDNRLELKVVPGKDNFLNKTIGSKMYLCKTLFQSQNQWTHFLFTNNITHSEEIKKK